MLCRVDKREMEREAQKRIKKLTKWLMKLNNEQRECLEEYCREASKNDILAFGQAFERVLRVKFQELFNNEFEAEALLNMIIDEVELEGKALKNFENGSVEYMANIKKERENIIELYTKHIQEGLNEKETFEEIKAAYPMFTASAIKNVIAEYKRDKKKEKAKSETAIEINSDMNTEEIAATILGETKENENKADTEEKEIKGIITQENEKESTEKVREPQNEEIKTSLVEITNIREFQGAYGKYLKYKDGTVKAGELEFKNTNDVEDCKKQIDEKLEEERKEFEKKQAEKRMQSLGRLDEVSELLLI